MGSAFCRHDGGPVAADIPTHIPPDQLKQLMVTTYKTEVVVDEMKANWIQLLTMNEHDDEDASTVWRCERRRQITSSLAGSIAKRRPTTPVVRMVHQKLYKTFRGSAATRWGLENESDSAKQYVTYLRSSSPKATVTTKCGLVVSVTHPWLAATPNGWVYYPTSIISPDGLVEFKNSSSYKDMAIKEAVTAKKCDCLTLTN